MALKKEKILFLLQVPPPVHGAALRNLSLVQSQVLKDTFHIQLLPLHFVDQISEIGNVSLKKFWRLAKFLFKLAGQLIFWRPRIIYFTISPIGNAFYRDVLIVLLITLFRIPIVYHLRGLGIRKAYQKVINRWLYNFVFKGNFIICLSNNHMQDIVGISCRQVKVVPNGIKLEASPKPFRKRDVPELLFLSNYIKSKGVLDFLESLKILNQRGLNFKATLVGAAWDVTNEELRDIARANEVEDKVIVNTPLFGERKFEAILNADIFVLPTYYELFPGVVLEAMQCAKPIVSTLTGAIPEIIDDGTNGFLVPTHSPVDIADKVELLIRDAALRRKLGEAALSKFINNYTLERFENNMKEAFEQILGTIMTKS